MAFELATEGQKCVDLVEDTYTNITSGCLDSVKENLKKIKRIGNELAEYSEQRANEIEKVEEEYIQKTEEVQRKIGDLGCQLEEEKKRKCELEANLSGKQARLAEEQKTLSAAERELSEAEGKLRHAKKKRRRRRGFGKLFGAVAGTLIAPGMGTVIGAATGGAVGGAIGGDFVGAARSKVDRCREQVQRAESDVSSTKKELSDIETQIASLLQQCGNLEAQKLWCNDEAKKMKEAVLFFHRAAMYWKEFKQISEHGVDRTALMQKIIRKAKEKEDLSWLHSNATKQVGSTFIEAWETIVTKCAEGSEFAFQIEQ